jgi:hypothetical protein
MTDDGDTAAMLAEQGHPQMYEALFSHLDTSGSQPHAASAPAHHPAVAVAAALGRHERAGSSSSNGASSTTPSSSTHTPAGVPPRPSSSTRLGQPPHVSRVAQRLEDASHLAGSLQSQHSGSLAPQQPPGLPHQASSRARSLRLPRTHVDEMTPTGSDSECWCEPYVPRLLHLC